MTAQFGLPFVITRPQPVSIHLYDYSLAALYIDLTVVLQKSCFPPNQLLPLTLKEKINK